MTYRHKKVKQHTTTMQLPTALYDQVRTLLDDGLFSSLNEFYLYAIRKGLDEQRKRK
jgi:Arc/MetJ-type ribon-helix-helix transcriptional regulator